MAGAPRLTWKREEFADPSGADSPGDVGPAWIVFPETPDAHGWSERVRGGEWITRAEAQQLASEGGFRLIVDAPGGSADDMTPDSPGFDVKAINGRLKALGIGKDELAVRASDAYLVLTGSLVQRLTRPEGSTSSYRTAAAVMRPEQAFSALDDLVPGWRTES